MTVQTRAVLKVWQDAGFRPKVGDMGDLIDSAVHMTEDAATSAEAQAGTATDKFVTPAALAAVTGTTGRAGLLELATDAEGITGTSTSLSITPAVLQAVLKGDVETLTGTALGTTRKIRGEYTLSATGVVSGNAVGVRGAVTLSGTVTGGAFLYGAQGKLIVSGTMNHADSRLCGLLAQIDTTGATLTTGQLSALWVDHGAGVTGAGGGQFNMIRITNTVAGSKPNAVIYAHSNATYLFDLSAPAGTMDWITAAGTSAGSAGKSDGCAAQSVLIVNIGGTPYYIPAFNQNT